MLFQYPSLRKKKREARIILAMNIFLLLVMGAIVINARLLKTIESGYGVVPLDFEFMLVDRLIPSEIKKLYK